MTADGPTRRSAALELAALAGPYHNVVYYSPEIRVFADAGLRGWWTAYFTYRSAPLGRVPAEVVTATFYGFAARMVARAIPAAWDVLSPERALELRSAAVDLALRRILGERVGEGQVVEAAALTRQAVEGCDVAGRPLFAAHASLPWPTEPHLALWHACTLLREQRGDAHSIALAAARVDGIECHVLMAARGHGNKASILPIRGWTADEWDAAAARLVARGWLASDATLTTLGREARRAIEAHTDDLADEPVSQLGGTGLARLSDVLGPLVTLLHEHGGVPRSWPPPHLLRSEPS